MNWHPACRWVRLHAMQTANGRGTVCVCTPAHALWSRQGLMTPVLPSVLYCSLGRMGCHHLLVTSSCRRSCATARFSDAGCKPACM